jgi:hypothetical protein
MYWQGSMFRAIFLQDFRAEIEDEFSAEKGE